MNDQIAVIATTISGSIHDWGKVKQIVPLFKEHGLTNVTLFSEDSHAAARERATEQVNAGIRWIISAGGSGTFNAVVEGCLNGREDVSRLRIGFLRKGSADLIGKVLDMPDEIEDAIKVFADAIHTDSHIPCDIVQVTDSATNTSRRFMGYGGFEIFGEVPYFTENRFIKYYKGVLSQLFGDLGPFFVGMSLASLKTLASRISGGTRLWHLRIDGDTKVSGRYQALILVNGDLGPNLPFAAGKQLGSGEFYLFGIRDTGIVNVPQQIKKAWDASILDDPDRWGFEAWTIKKQLEIKPADGLPYPVNTDGSTFPATSPALVEIVNQVKLIRRVSNVSR